MILVYPYRYCPHNGRELRYSIRSMVKHFKDLTGVCVIGDRPEWFTGDYIPARDITGRKEWSIVSKVMLAPAGVFLLSSDDVFALKDFDVNMPFYYSGSLSSARARAAGQYPQRISNTIQLYPEGLMYDCHTPMVINKDAYCNLHGKCNWQAREYLNKSVYANGIHTVGEHIPDCKIRRGSVIPNLPFFSTSDQTSLNIPLETMYPDASPYEKNT